MCVWGQMELRDVELNKALQFESNCGFQVACALKAEQQHPNPMHFMSKLYGQFMHLPLQYASLHHFNGQAWRDCQFITSKARNRAPGNLKMVSLLPPQSCRKREVFQV